MSLDAAENLMMYVAVVGEHRLVPRSAQLQLRVVLRYPVQHLHHPLAVVIVGDGREELVEP